MLSSMQRWKCSELLYRMPRPWRQCPLGTESLGLAFPFPQSDGLFPLAALSACSIPTHHTGTGGQRLTAPQQQSGDTIPPSRAASGFPPVQSDTALCLGGPHACFNALLLPWNLNPFNKGPTFLSHTGVHKLGSHSCSLRHGLLLDLHVCCFQRQVQEDLRWESSELPLLTWWGMEFLDESA